MQVGTRYDLIGTIANPKYHHIHIALVNMLYRKTNDIYFLKTASRWESYRSHFVIRYFLKGHPTINSLVVLLLVLSLWLCISLATYIFYTRLVSRHTCNVV